MFKSSFSENIIANAPLGIITTDPRGIITFINRFACKIHRQNDPLKFVRMHVSIVPHKNADKFMLAFQQVLNGEKEKAVAEYSVTQEDNTVFVRATITILRDENYTPTGVLLMCEDLNEQRLLYDKLIREKQFSENIIETANMLIVGIRQDGRTILFNHTAENVTGFSREEAVGKDWFSLFAPEDVRAEIVDSFYGVIDDKAPAYREHPILTRSGEERLIGWHKTYLNNLDGDSAGIIAIGEDITEKRKLEEQLINERERLDVILTSLGAGLFLIDRNYRVTYENALIKNYFGDLVGKQCCICLKEKSDENERKTVCKDCPVRKVLEKGAQQVTQDIQGRDQNGDDLWMELIATPVYDENGEIAGALELVVPINERKKLEQQLIQAQKMEAVGMLTGGIAHDFNNVIGSILGYSALMRETIDKNDKSFKYIDMIQSAVRHATGLTERLLSFSRRTRKRSAIIRINELINNVLALLRSSMGPKIRMKTVLSKGRLLVLGDKTQLEQLIMNIVINARDAMPDGGTIEIGTSKARLDEKFCKKHLGAQTGDNVVISISDNGTGMDQETLNSIFEPFFTTKQEGKGTGLGLSIVHSVVRGHKGYIQVESKKGKGAKFSIYLPATRQKDVDTSTGKGKAMQDGETILVVDNEDVVRSLLNDSLTSLGYNILLASCGDEAMRIFEKSFEEIDLAIIDMIMPDINGKQTLDQMRMIKPDIKAIISASEPKVRDGFDKESEMSARILQKPYKFSELADTVQEVLDS